MPKRSFPPTHEDKKADKLIEKIEKKKAEKTSLPPKKGPSVAA